MFATMLLMLFTAMFIIVNIVLGCYAAVRYGYGPPDWRTALNLVVRITVLQSKINTWREVIDRKCPWADRLLNRLHVPKPIVLVEIVDEEDELAEDSGSRDVQTDQNVHDDQNVHENGSAAENDTGGENNETGNHENSVTKIKITKQK